jgi:hypothetical protein
MTTPTNPKPTRGPTGPLGRICAALNVTDGAAALAEVERLKAKQAECLTLEASVAGLKTAKAILDCRAALRDAVREKRLDRQEADALLAQLDAGTAPTFAQTPEGVAAWIAVHPPRLGSRGE